jgi:hypothetical protein
MKALARYTHAFQQRGLKIFKALQCFGRLAIAPQFFQSGAHPNLFTAFEPTINLLLTGFTW